MSATDTGNPGIVEGGPYIAFPKLLVHLFQLGSSMNFRPRRAKIKDYAAIRWYEAAKRETTKMTILLIVIIHDSKCGGESLKGFTSNH